MAIPWTTALYVVRKILPVVIDKATELLKTLERRRTAASHTDERAADRSVELLHQRILSLEQISAAQTELLAEFQATLKATKRAVSIAWMILLAAVLIETTMLAVLLFRP
jgi:hypothetical protein